MRNVFYVLPFLLATACAAESRPGAGDDDDAPPTGEACSAPGATRCADSEYQTCEGGQWHVSESCGAGETCFSGSGCAECDPSHVRVCMGSDVVTCQGGQLGDVVEHCGTAGCNGGSCGGAASDCSEATQVIYVVDKNNNFLSFDPRHDANTFHLIGRLNCQAGVPWPETLSLEASPFSMSVDRNGEAWVLYSSGEIFRVNTSDASCERSNYLPGSNGFQLFGMGFVSDTAGGDSETLFVSGGSASIALPNDTTVPDLGMIDLGNFSTTKLGHISRGPGQRSPEVTGLGNGELWAYFPGSGLFSQSAIAQLDKMTGNRMRTFTLPGEVGLVDAWAFAHYGGRYYIFVTSGPSKVMRLDPMGNNGAGRVDTILQDTGYVVVGAGVSTCAPVIVE
jgi:hypothetical protein